MTEKKWKKIFAVSIWTGSILGVLGFLQYILYYFHTVSEIFYYSGNIFFLSGIFVLVISIIIAIGTSIYFIFN